MSHTPGPWQGEENCVVTTTGRGVAILEPDPSPGFWGDDVVAVSDDEEMTANLHLIVAAPDLLAACEQVLAGFRYEKGRPVMPEWQMKQILEAAIRKARGEDNT